MGTHQDPSLSDVAFHFLGIKLCKLSTLANWCRNKLSFSHQHYALLDAAVLHALAKAMGCSNSLNWSVKDGFLTFTSAIISEPAA